MKTLALRLEKLAVVAGGRRILDGIDLDIDAGSVIAIIGPNGAGKTTLLDAISGTIPDISGQVQIGGAQSSPRGGGRPRVGVGRVFQGSPLPETLTVAEVITLAARDREHATTLMHQFGLTSYATRFVSELSTGMRRILDLATAASSAPAVLLLDEPASGLAQAEIEHLANVVRAWRDATGGSVVMVEHDAWLVNAVADRVIMLEAGRIESDGTADEVLDHIRSRTKPRMRSPADPRFAQMLGRVSEAAIIPPEVPTRTVSAWTILRLGLREFSAGMSSVLLLGVLNRVLKVEFGISLGIVAAVLASYNLAAPIALAVGHRSDTRPIFGRRRVPYILAGTVIAGVCVAAAPHLVTRLSGGLDAFTIIASIALFIAMGVGMYGAGAVFLALLADLVPEKERSHAVSIVYIELVLGVLAGVALVGGVLEDDVSNLGTLFAIAGVLIIVLATIAVWGKEPRMSAEQVQAARLAGSGDNPDRVTFRRAISSIVSLKQARIFFGFMVLSNIFMLLQQAVLEPYGGEVLGLGVSTTAAFNAVMTIGILAGMFTAGRPFAARFGHKVIARWGLMLASAAFGMLAISAFVSSAPPSWFAMFWIGVGTGVFTVAGLSLMMGMVDTKRTAMFMGAWTIARAIADATAIAGGGTLFEVLASITGSNAAGYGIIFAVESVGLIVCLPLLGRFDPARFEAEISESAAMLAARDSLPPVVDVVTEPAGEEILEREPVGSVSRGAPASKPSPKRSGAKPPRSRSGGGS